MNETPPHPSSSSSSSSLPRFNAILLTFFVSAVFHELLLGVPLHMVRLWAFAGIMFQVRPGVGGGSGEFKGSIQSQNEPLPTQGGIGQRGRGQGRREVAVWGICGAGQGRRRVSVGACE